MIACVAFESGNTLTSAATPIDSHLGMRPVDPQVVPALRLLRSRGLRLRAPPHPRASDIPTPDPPTTPRNKVEANTPRGFRAP